MPRRLVPEAVQSGEFPARDSPAATIGTTRVWSQNQFRSFRGFRRKGPRPFLEVAVLRKHSFSRCHPLFDFSSILHSFSPSFLPSCIQPSLCDDHIRCVHHVPVLFWVSFLSLLLQQGLLHQLPPHLLPYVLPSFVCSDSIAEFSNRTIRF